MTKREYQQAEYRAEVAGMGEADKKLSDADRLRECDDWLTQLVIKAELRSGRSENIVMGICDELRAIAARLSAQVSVEDVVELARKKKFPVAVDVISVTQEYLYAADGSSGPVIKWWVHTIRVVKSWWLVPVFFKRTLQIRDYSVGAPTLAQLAAELRKD